MPRSSLVKFDRLLINSWWTTNSVWKINQCLNTQSWLLMLQKNLGLINRRSWRPLLHVPKKIVQSNSGTFLLCKILVIWKIISFSSWNILIDNMKYIQHLYSLELHNRKYVTILQRARPHTHEFSRYNCNIASISFLLYPKGTNTNTCDQAWKPLS